LAKWLQAHPGVEIISRDRSNEYAKGAMVGAPNAHQVADRWHLIKNLREALELFLEQNRHCLRAAGETGGNSEGREPSLDPASEENQTIEKLGAFPCRSDRSKLTKLEAKRQIIRNKRLERYNKVVELHNQGNAIREIARQLGLHRTTRPQVTYMLESFRR